MNATAAATPNQSSVALAFLNGTSALNTPKSIQNGTPVAAGFTDLINALFGSALLGSISPGSESPGTLDAGVSDPASQPQTKTIAASAQSPDLTIASAVLGDPQQTELATPQQAAVPAVPASIPTDGNIAQAMIRSMLGAPKRSSLPSTAKLIDPKVAKSSEKVIAAFSLTPVAAPVTVPFTTDPAANQRTSNPTGATNSDRFSQSMLKNPQLEILTPSAAQLASSAPVAFSAKLTPLDAQAQPSVQTDPSTEDVVTPATILDHPRDPRATNTAHDADRDELVAPVAMVAAAAASYSGGFSQGFQDTPQTNTAPANASADAKTPANFGTVGESIRASESMAIANAPPTAALSSAPVQSITMRINPPDGHPDMPAVDLQVSSRGNEIHVAVRTSDAQLESAMRQDLGTLSSSLDRAGYRTETYVPRDTVREIGHEIGFTAAQQGSASSQENRESSHDQAHDQSQQNFTGRDSGGSPHGRQQQGRQNQGQDQGQNQRQNQRFRNWIFEMEK